MPRTLAVALLAASLTSTGCGLTGGSPSDEERAVYAETLPTLGQAVDFWFSTHCGVENVRIGGVWWQAVPPLYGNDGPGDPPDGWDNPHQLGRLTVLSSERATFEAHGVRVILVPSPSGQPLRICR